MVVKSPFVMHHGLIDTLFRDYSLAQANASIGTQRRRCRDDGAGSVGAGC